MTETQIRGLRKLTEAVEETAGNYAIIVVRKGKKFYKMIGISEEVAARFMKFYRGAVVVKVA